MPFIGDYGWFYLSARDMLLTGHIPLIGITSSHTWLHQGPYWAYILAVFLFLFKFNPVAGGFASVFFGIGSIFLTYKVGKELFSYKVGILSSVLYATSPLIVVHARIPYHTSPIPFFVLLFILFMYKWVKSFQGFYFAWTLIILAILYNFELATQVLWFVLFGVIGFGIWKKTKYVQSLKSKNTIFLSVCGYLFPLIPILIYDISHGFPQTVKFFLWIPYKIMVFVPSTFHKVQDSVSFWDMVQYYSHYYTRLIFPESSWVVLLITLVTLGWFLKKKDFKGNYILVYLCFFVPFLGFLINKTPSEAYIPIFFPSVIFITVLALDYFFKSRFKLLLYVCIGIISTINSYYLFSNNFLIGIQNGYGVSLSKRIAISKKIIAQSHGEKYNLLGVGKGSKHSSFVMGYEYLLWWLGNEPSKEKQDMQFVILDPDANPRIKLVFSKKP